MSIFADHNLPFLIAFGALAVVALLQLIGVAELFDGMGDGDVSPGLDAGGIGEALSSLLGFGRVPLMVWLTCLLFTFGAIGLIGQSVLTNALGAPLPAGLAMLMAAGVALPFNGLTIRPLAAIMPQDETTAVPLDALVRRDAEIQIGTARAGSPARAKVLDTHGQAHFVMVEPHDASTELLTGDTVLLIRREGETFYGIHYESPLLGLES
ncbi:MAG: OB-fold-containig protein [Erythrobacter sp.]